MIIGSAKATEHELIPAMGCEHYHFASTCTMYLCLDHSTGQFDVEDDNMQAAQSAQSTLRTRRTNSFNYQKQVSSQAS